jgi:hypothetical protein
MGADSMTLVRDGQRSKYFTNATKVFELRGLPIVAMTYGVGAIGRRTIGSLVEEWSRHRIAYEKVGYTVLEVAQSLGGFVFSRHREHRALIQADLVRRQSEALSKQGEGASKASDEIEEFDPVGWMTGLVVGGYQPQSPHPFLYTWEEPARPGILEGLACVRDHEGESGADGPASGVDYWGETLPLDRLFRGYDPALIGALSTAVRGPEISEIIPLIDSFKWDLLCEGMPLQDAADLAKFMLQTACAMEKFRDGNPLIGGDLDIAVVTKMKIHWYERKALTRALADIREISGDYRPDDREKQDYSD